MQILPVRGTSRCIVAYFTWRLDGVQQFPVFVEYGKLVGVHRRQNVAIFGPILEHRLPELQTD